MDEQRNTDAEPAATGLCPECGSNRIVRDDRDEDYCESCGLVLEDQPIDPGPEWRAFTAAESDERSRTGAPENVMLHDKGLSTMIGWPGRDSYGRRIPSANRAQLHRMRTWNRRTRMSSGAERNMAHALSELQRMASRMGLPRSVREAASVLYRRAMKEGLIKGRSIDGVAAASLYAACRQCNVPRTLEEVAEETDVSKKAVARAYRALARELKLKLAPTSPTDYLSRFTSELELGPDARRRATEILEAAARDGRTAGKTPTGLAAAALYLAAQQVGDPRTQKEIAAVSHVSEVTIRNRARELEEAADTPTVKA